MSRFGRYPCAVIFIVAVLARGAALWYVETTIEAARANDPERRFLIEGDANGYWTLAERIATGRSWHLYDAAPRYVMRMPGFPLLLAAVIKAGGGPFAARGLIIFIAATGSSLVFLLGRRLFDDRVGWVAGLWVGLSPTLVGFAPLILTESVFATSLTLSVLLLHITKDRLDHDRSAIGPAILTGLAVAAATYVRPTWLMAAPTFAVCLWVAHRRSAGLRAAATVCVVALASLLPWAVRNVRVTGHFVMTTLWVGPSLYDGLHPGATGASDMAFFESDRKLNELGEYGANRYYTRAALDFAWQNPARAVVLGLRKLSRFWSPLPNATQFQSTLPRMACLAGFVPIMLFAVLGMWHARQQTWPLIICAAPIIYFSLLHIVFVGSLRYRLPAEYPLSVLAAYGFTRAFPKPRTAG